MAMVKQNFTLEKELMEQVRSHAEKTGLKMSTIVRCALYLYFKTESLKEKRKRMYENKT